jgi:hypothetical protein
MLEGEKESPEIEMQVSEAQDMVDGENKLPVIEMPRKILPSMEIITTVIQVPDENQRCIPPGRRCVPNAPPKCCRPYRCIRCRRGSRCVIP